MSKLQSLNAENPIFIITNFANESSETFRGNVELSQVVVIKKMTSWSGFCIAWKIEKHFNGKSVQALTVWKDLSHLKVRCRESND